MIIDKVIKLMEDINIELIPENENRNILEKILIFND